MIPPVASLEAPLQREKRERTKRENRERKEKRERKEREQRENREKRERKEREKTEKRERKEREKREKRERTEREKRENRERKDKEKRAERERAEREQRESRERESRERGMGFQSPPRPPPHPSPPSGGAHQPLGSTCGSGLEIIRKGGPRGTTLWWLFFKIYIFFKTPPLCPPPSYLLLKGLGALTRLPSTGFPLLALAWCCL